LLELESHGQDIAQAQVDLLKLAIKYQYTYEQWHNVVNFFYLPRNQECLDIIS
jgi:hypothetical protein